MTRDEAIKILKPILFLDKDKDEALHMAIEVLEHLDNIEAYMHDFDVTAEEAIKALERPIPKPHDRLMYWETARRIIDSPRSKSQMLAVLDSVPPVETLERKHGEWIHHENPKGIFSLECPFCKCWFLHEHLVRNSFCPNCGADMRGDEDEC